MSQIHLQELIYQISRILLSPKDRILYIANPDIRERLRGKFPECFVSLKMLSGDRTDLLLPICNRAGIIDPMAINVSLKFVKKLMADYNYVEKFDQEELQKVLNRLIFLKRRFSKMDVKPPSRAARKAVVTRSLRKLKLYLDTIQ